MKSIFNKNHIFEFLKFSIVGLSNTIVSFSTYYFLIFLNVHYAIANTLGFIIGVFNSYFWNHKYVFPNNKFNLKDLSKTYLSYFSTFLLNTITLVIMVESLGIPNTIAPIINIVYSVPLNYILNKFWVFRKKVDL